MSTTTLHPHGVMGVPWTFAPKEQAATFTLEWEPPADIFGTFSRYLLLRKEGTNTPITDPADVTATEVTFVGQTTRTTATLTDDPGAGWWMYSLFVVYDEWGDGSLRYSEQMSAIFENAADPGPDSPPSDPPATTYDIQWVSVPDFYAFRRYIVRRASGSTAPTGPTDGTEVTLIDETDRTTYGVDDAPGSGTWSYSVFVAYDEYGSGTDERFSLAMTETRVIP